MPARIPAFRPPRLRTAAKRDESGRPNAAARGYCDKAHRLWRQAVLNKCNWQCVDCKRVAHGREMHADHVVPISQGGARYDVANGEARCVNCHSRKTAKEYAAKCNSGRGGLDHGG